MDLIGSVGQGIWFLGLYKKQDDAASLSDGSDRDTISYR